MSRKYDSLTSIFTPEGRLLQVENAIKNISNAGLCIGIVTSQGVILASESESVSKLLQKGKYSEKIYTIDRNIAISVGGLAADANLLIDYAREFTQNYFYKYKEYSPIENLVKYVSDIMQMKTQFGSSRPYGTGFLFGGWDKVNGYQLFNTEPSGIYNTWKAHAIGKNDQSAQSSLKRLYKEDLNLGEGVKLAVKVMKKSLDKNKMNEENLEVFVIRRENREMVQKFLDKREIEMNLKEVEKEEEEEKKKDGEKMKF